MDMDVVVVGVRVGLMEGIAYADPINACGPSLRLTRQRS